MDQPSVFLAPDKKAMSSCSELTSTTFEVVLTYHCSLPCLYCASNSMLEQDNDPTIGKEDNKSPSTVQEMQPNRIQISSQLRSIQQLRMSSLVHKIQGASIK